MRGFVILDGNGREVIQASRYYRTGFTKNEAESFALRDALACLAKLVYCKPELHHPVQVFGDSQLMIRFMTRLFKKPSHRSIYRAYEQMKQIQQKLGVAVAYRHVMREANVVPDDMARRPLSAQGTVIYWQGSLMTDTPDNQLRVIYE